MSMKGSVLRRLPACSMPDFTQTPFDRIGNEMERRPVPDTAAIAAVKLPASGWAALVRGLRGKCPRCEAAPLFMRFLKPVPRCPCCEQDWRHQQADDFPAYISIFITGHLLAPIIIALARDAEISLSMLAAIIFPLASVLMIGLLQPAKGAVIAVQWWFGMHGFKRERLSSAAENADT